MTARDILKVNRREAIGIGLAGASLVLSHPSAAAVNRGRAAIVSPRTCGLVDPLSLGNLLPRFSWYLGDTATGTEQISYRVTVARSEEDLSAGRNLLWDSGKVISSQSLDVAYGGPALPSRSRAVWQVEVWARDSITPLRSAAAIWETGLTAPSDWRGDWLASETEVARADRLAGLHWIGGTPSPKAGEARHFRWSIEHASGAAELCLSAHEVTGIWLNGEPVAASGRDPVSWTQMAVYPITLAQGRNVIAISVKRQVGFGVPPPVLCAVLRHGPRLGQRLTSASTGWRVSNEVGEGWQTTSFGDSNWTAASIATGVLPVGEPWPVYPANMLRRSFMLSAPVRRARLHATALGVYEATINDKSIDDRKLAPEFTDPSKRVLYQTYDITALLTRGENMLGFMVGDGWYGSKFSSSGRFAFGAAPCRLLAQLEIEYDDGRRDVIATDGHWQICEAPVQASSLYDGEMYDARLERALMHDEYWRPAERIERPPVAVEPQRCPPIRVRERRKATSIRRLAPGRFVLDFGQNFAGWPRLTINAKAGTHIEMRFAELLGSDGGVDQSNLRTALQRDIFIAAGTGEETWVPRFTYHGFQYVEISGAPDDLSQWSLEALVGYQDLELTGKLQVGDPVVQKFWENSVWSQKSNFFGLPTDCPQRDERLGWMGDAEVFWPAAAFNMDIGAFTARVMEDVCHGQSAKGGFPDCIPPFVPTMKMSSPGWADAGVILPWTSWRQFGDTGVIRANWLAMERYLDWLFANNPGHLWVKNRGADYGDWLSVDANPKNPGDATTPKELVGTAFWAQNAQMMADMAEAIGEEAAAAKYRALFAAIRQAFNGAYVAPDGTVGNGSQTSFVLAIRFGLLSPQLILEAGRRLTADIARRGNHLSTGFLGTPHILDALAVSGQSEMAVTLLLERTRPSWGFMVEKGATTMWERWNSDEGDVSMNSRNHYAFGAIGSFLFRRVAGIAALEPGFTKVEIAPLMDPRLATGGATYRSVKGPMRTEWEAKDGRFRLDVELPAGVTGEVSLPGHRSATAPPGLSRFSGHL